MNAAVAKKLPNSTKKFFYVIDTPSGLVVDKYSTRIKAESQVIKLDHKEGGFRYRVEEK